jgi:hypothetical protein
MFHQGDLFARLDKFNIFLLAQDTAANATYLYELYGYRETDLKSREPYIVFSTTPVFQITSGTRKGSLQPSSLLLPGERFMQKTSRRKLEEGTAENVIDIHRERDQFLLQLLQDLEEHGFSAHPNMVFPETYLCCPPQNDVLTCRKTTDAQKWVMDGFRNSWFDQDEFIAKRKLFATSAGFDAEGYDRVAYPYRYVYGRGVVCISPDLSGTWYAVPTEQAAFLREDVRVSFPGVSNAIPT